jgi:hypothetical protein
MILEQIGPRRLRDDVPGVIFPGGHKPFAEPKGDGFHGILLLQEPFFSQGLMDGHQTGLLKP